MCTSSFSESFRILYHNKTHLHLNSNLDFINRYGGSDEKQDRLSRTVSLRPRRACLAKKRNLDRVSSEIVRIRSLPAKNRVGCLPGPESEKKLSSRITEITETTLQITFRDHHSPILHLCEAHRRLRRRRICLASQRRHLL